MVVLWEVQPALRILIAAHSIAMPARVGLLPRLPVSQILSPAMEQFLVALPLGNAYGKVDRGDVFRILAASQVRTPAAL